MKIIGTDGKNGFIAYLTKDEFAQLAGFNGEYYARDQIRMEPGSEIKIARMYDDAKTTLSNYKEIKESVAQNIKRLGKLAEMLEVKTEKTEVAK